MVCKVDTLHIFYINGNFSENLPDEIHLFNFQSELYYVQDSFCRNEDQNTEKIP